MDRQYYIYLAASGLRMPIGTDLVLREKSDHHSILTDGRRLGMVVEEAAKRYKSPIAIPLMDLSVEKEAMLTILGIKPEDISTYHFDSAPSPEAFDSVDAGMKKYMTPRMQANTDAIRYIAEHTDLVPCGMSIGPFSLMTKLLRDPIYAVYLSGTGVTADDEPEVDALEKSLELGLHVILQSIADQVKAGAKMMILCEPAANLVYLSPKQLSKGSDIFERLVMAPNRRIKAMLDALNVDLFLHDCGELTDSMVEQLASLNPMILSLGSSRKLWEDAQRVSKEIVLYGNLPTKRFYSDDLSVDAVKVMAAELLMKMKETGHPFILGSECDVLCVPEAVDAIKAKVAAFAECEYAERKCLIT